jgi:arylsulfatase A-like enzyme
MMSKLTRRKLLTTALGGAASVLLAPSVLAATRRPPNFIVIQCDDMGYGDWGEAARGLIKTPNLDRMAREGTTLTDFYAGANICTPSRAAMLTGRYAIRTGLGHGVILQNDKRVLPTSERTIAAALSRTHASALIGKWHLGHIGPDWMPTRHGFDYYFGIPYSHDMTPLALYEARQGGEATTAPADIAMLQQQFCDKALAFIDANRDRPFFLDLALSAPHLPAIPHPDFHGKSGAGPYGDAVEEIDSIVGRLLAHLQKLGIARDTLVVFTSDNGPWFEGSTGGLRQRKGGAGYDGGYRVPAIAWRPGTIPAGRRSSAIGMSIDFLPTFCAMAGVVPPEGVTIDGRDLSAAWLAGAASPHEELLLFNDEDVVALRTQRWKLVTADYYRNYLLDLPSRGYPQLYDMVNDPSESFSVAERHPEVVADLTARIEAARARLAPLRTHPSGVIVTPPPAPPAD